MLLIKYLNLLTFFQIIVEVDFLFNVFFWCIKKN